MNEGSTMEVQGVMIPPEAVAHSIEVKASRKKTLSQIPVYRASANLMYVATEIVMRMPNKLRKFSDLMLQNANDLLITIGSADQSRTDEDRVEYVNSMGSEFWRYFIVRGHYNSIRARPQYRPIELIF